MQKNNPDRLEKLRQQRERLSAKIAQEEARTRAKAKQERGAKLLLWGEVVEALLDAGEMTPALWAAHCRKFIPEGRKLDFALKGLQTEAMPSAQSGAAPDTEEIPQDKPTGTSYS